MRGRKGRLGGIFLGGFGVALGLLMVYSLVFEEVGANGRASMPFGRVEVPVFFIERSEWRIFARGVKVCAEPARKLGRLINEEDDGLLVETYAHRRPVRFTWRAVRGEGQTREEVHRLLESSEPPMAIVGSSNTVLTTAIAAQLREDGSGRPGGGPLLLVPWATSVSLLDLNPGRTFRFCSNNRREADLIVDRLKHEPRSTGPRRVVIVVDGLDPYSIDLAACFREAIKTAFPKAEIVESSTEPSSRPRSRFATITNAAEQGRAKAIWRDVIDGPNGETWVILPLQNEPARRMLVSLNGAAPGNHDALARPVTVICGDAIGLTTLQGFVNQLVFPVWGVSMASDFRAPNVLEDDVQEQAEIVATILRSLDQPTAITTADALRAAILQPVPLDGEPFAPFGRPIVFDSLGERTQFPPGAILSLPMGAAKVAVVSSEGWLASKSSKPGSRP